ncbi:MAG: tannase/feruloyl esterase family alpha/beta hydrolase [Pseudomonadota bacterium]
MKAILGIAALATSLAFVLPASAQAAQPCAALAAVSIPAGAIGLPTTGAVVTSAADTSTPANGNFCKVLGAIHPVDPAAPDILFQLNLPANWNSKALQMGGGGYNGRLVTGEDGRFPDPKKPLPLGQGYATFGSDSGHETKQGEDAAAFAANAEALRNFGGDQIKKTHDVAVFLIRQHYGQAPRRMYFQGNSQGGHEGFEAVQRYPADYDGVIAIHPVYDFAALQLDGVLLGQALYNKPGAWVSPDKATAVTKAQMDACDGLDGARDGLIGNLAACHAAFHIDSLRCAGGADTGATCLSDAQLATYKTFAAPMPFTVTLSGIDHFAGWPVLDGADLNGRANTFGAEPKPSIPATPRNSFLYMMGDTMARDMVVRDTASDSLTFDQNRNATQLAEVSRVIDGSSDDITAFQKRGGKLLMMHGTIDMAVSPYNSVEYYERLKKRYGEAELKKFVRFYMAPGFGHGYGSFIVGWDSLGALDAWVEHGAAPGLQVATDTGPAGQGRQRPLCEYPSWPKYSGSGDINAAASFSCTTK